MPQAQQKGPGGEIAHFVLRQISFAMEAYTLALSSRQKNDCRVYFCDSVNLVHCPSKTPSGTTGAMSFKCSIATKARQSHGQIYRLLLPIL
jgi:hypothetical protein